MLDDVKTLIVGVSGGADSMALLKFLGKSKNDFKVLKINLYTLDKTGNLVDIDDVVEILNLSKGEIK